MSSSSFSSFPPLPPHIVQGGQHLEGQVGQVAMVKGRFRWLSSQKEIKETRRECKKSGERLITDMGIIWQAFIGLLERGHRQAFDELQERPGFQIAVKDYIRDNPQMAEQHPALARLGKALQILDHCPDHMKPQKHLLLVLYLIYADRFMKPQAVHLLLKSLPKEIRADFLAEKKEWIPSYYAHTSFLNDVEVDFSQNGKASDLSASQWQVFIELIKSWHTPTLDEIQEERGFQLAIQSYVKDNLEIAAQDPAWSCLWNGLHSFQCSPRHFKSEKKFLRALLYIEKERGRMEAGVVGVDSKRQPGMFKLASSDFPYSITYDPKTGKAAEIKRYLDEGASKIVKKALDLRSFETLAISRQGIKNKGVTKKEVEMMEACKGLSHIVQLREASYYESDEKGLFQILSSDFYNGGSLRQQLQQLSEDQKLQVASDILTGVMNLHAKGIIHRDLKPENIFLQFDENRNGVVHAFIGDLGLSCWKDRPDPDRKYFMGTAKYVPPEVWEGNEADFDGDAWAIGLILSELFLGCLSYAEDPAESARLSSYEDYFNAIKKLQYKPEPTPDAFKNNLFEYEIRHMIWKLTRPNRKERMEVAETLSIVEALNFGHFLAEI